MARFFMDSYPRTLLETLALALCAAAAVAVAACGGGSGDTTTSPQVGRSSPPRPHQPPPQAATNEPTGGIYGASIPGFAQPSMIYFAQANGLPFALLGEASPNGFNARGFLITHTGASWTPSNEPGWAYNSSFYPTGPEFGNSVVGYTVHATYQPALPSLTGTLVRSSGSWTFSGGPLEHSGYSFNTPMPVAQAVGHWELRDLSDQPAVIEIDGQGGMQGRYQGCALSGNVAPSPGSTGYLTMTAQLDAATCPSRSDTAPVPYRGFVLVYPLNGGSRQMILYGSASWDESAFPAADSLVATGVR